MNRKIRFLANTQNDHIKRQPTISKWCSYFPAVFSVFVVLLLFYFFRYLAPFVYQTNDDLFLRMIVSGEMSGEPESHLFYISYPTGLIISNLYKLFPLIPWYGLFLYSAFILAMIVILYSLLRSVKSLPARLFTAVLFCLVSYGFLFSYVADMQYTITTSIVGCGSLFLFILATPSDSFPKSLKNHSGFLLLSAYTLCIRDQVFFMLLPFVGMIGLGKYLNAGKESSVNFFHLNKQRKNLVFIACIFITISAFFFMTEKLAYQQENWHTFSEYTRSRTLIYDYEGYPDYETYQDTYQELGISRSSYEAAAQRYCLILEPAINQKNMTVLENISRQKKEISDTILTQKLLEMAEFFLERHRSDADKPLNLLVYRCYLLFIICAIFSRKWIALRDVLFILFARMVIWAYLIFYGRLPIRISQSVYLAELAALFAIAFGYKLWSLHVHSEKTIFRQKICYTAWIISILLIVFTCIRSGIPHARSVAEQSISRLQFSESFTIMKDYFNDHPDNFYYLDTNSFSYFTEDALQTGAQKDSNYIFMGGWAAKSPWYEKKFEKAGISDPAAALYENPSVYAVFMNTEETGYDYLEAFYSENYPDVHIEERETVDAGNGISFLVLKAVPEKTP